MGRLQLSNLDSKNLTLVVLPNNFCYMEYGFIYNAISPSTPVQVAVTDEPEVGESDEGPVARERERERLCMWMAIGKRRGSMEERG